MSAAEVTPLVVGFVQGFLATSAWDPVQNRFGRLLQEFNTSMDRLAAFGVLLFSNAFVPY